MGHFCLLQEKAPKQVDFEREEEAYQIKVTDHNDNEESEIKDKLKSRLKKHIKDEAKLSDCVEQIIKDFDGYEPDEEASQDINLPYTRDEYMPWTESVTEPANPNSFATKITMQGINQPEKKVYCPNGEPKKKKSVASLESIEDKARSVGPRSNQHRLSVRQTNLDLARGSLISEMSAANDDEIPMPKFHQEYYANPSKKEELDNHASWISFILFEESRRMERLAQLEEEDEEVLSLTLRKNSSFINIATKADQSQNFTKNKIDYDRESFIIFDDKRYEKRRASSVIKKISSPMPKQIVDCMKQFKTWNYDAFLLNDLTGNNPL